jgi:hypothetical protein
MSRTACIREGKETWVFRPDAANAALKMADSELGLLREHRKSEFDNLSDLELMQLLQQPARALLEDATAAERPVPAG